MLSKNNEGATRDCIFVCVGEESEVNSSHLNKDNKTAEELFAAAMSNSMEKPRNG